MLVSIFKSKFLFPSSESRVLLFCNTKRLVNDTAEAMIRSGNKGVQPLHGDLSFPARQRGLARFRTGEARVLIATDVVARGIDVKVCFV